MEKSHLGNSDVLVSKICLGTMTWGQQNSEKEAHEQLDYAFERGVNFIDTAEMYPVPPMGETYSKTEQYIGNWEKLHSQRENIILATKVIGPADWMPWVRDGKSRLTKNHIKEALNDSLKRLKVDYIDLYQLHWPDRSTNFFGERGYKHNNDEQMIHPEETLEALSEIQKSGKVRAFGLSNETPWGTLSFLNLAEKKSLPRMLSVQNPYNLLNRTYESGMAEISIRENCGLLAYSPLAFGVLSGKYLNGMRPKGARLSTWERFDRYIKNTSALNATEKYVTLAQKYNLDPAQMALAFVNSRPFLTSSIIGATNLDQLKSNIDSAEIELPNDLLAEIEEIHDEIPNPCP